MGCIDCEQCFNATIAKCEDVIIIQSVFANAAIAVITDQFDNKYLRDVVTYGGNTYIYLDGNDSHGAIEGLIDIAGTKITLQFFTDETLTTVVSFISGYSTFVCIEIEVGHFNSYIGSIIEVPADGEFNCGECIAGTPNYLAMFGEDGASITDSTIFLNTDGTYSGQTIFTGGNFYQSNGALTSALGDNIIGIDAATGNLQAWNLNTSQQYALRLGQGVESGFQFITEDLSGTELNTNLQVGNTSNYARIVNDVDAAIPYFHLVNGIVGAEMMLFADTQQITMQLNDGISYYITQDDYTGYHQLSIVETAIGVAWQYPDSQAHAQINVYKNQGTDVMFSSDSGDSELLIGVADGATQTYLQMWNDSALICEINSSGIKTGNISAGHTARYWKMADAQAGAPTPDSKIFVSVGGTLYALSAQAV